MYVIYSLLVFRPKRLGKMRLIFIICLKGCNCCTFVDILACSKLRNCVSCAKRAIQNSVQEETTLVETAIRKE